MSPLALLVVMASAPTMPVKDVVVAAEPTVFVEAEVVYASTRAGQVDPTLKKMQDTLGAKVKYLTLRRVSTQRLELVNGRPAHLSLPNQKTAELRLVTLKDGVAVIGVKLAPADTTYTLGHEKSLYLQGGPHDGGDLWVVLSQPR